MAGREEKQKSISDLLEEAKEEMCDNYCKFSEQAKDEEELWNTICDKCPLNKL